MKEDKTVLEEGTEVRLNFRKLKKYFLQNDGREREIMPVVVQDVFTCEVLILAFVNRQAFDYSLRTGQVAFWSTSRNEFWVKGMTSGSFLEIVEIRVNCDQNSLLYLVKQVNNAGACHTKEKGGYRKSCYYRRISDDGKKLTKLRRKEK